MTQFYMEENTETEEIWAAGTIENLPPAVADTIYTVQVYAYESGDTNGTAVIGQSAEFTVKGITFVNGVDITYPPNDKKELAISDTYRPKLGVSFTGNPTYETGKWSSSDEDIATIEPDGQVVLTGKKIGEVWFTFTADDGDWSDPNPDNKKSAISEIYTVTVGDYPALLIPAEVNYIVTSKEKATQVRWSSNASFFTDKNFEFTVELFEGFLDENKLSEELFRYKTEVGNDKNSVIIPGGNLTKLSESGAPAYTIRVSMPHPLEGSDKLLSALCYIVVNPLPAIAHINRPDSFYLLGGTSVDIQWSIDNYETTTVGELIVTRVTTEDGKDKAEEIVKEPVSSQEGTYNLTLDTVSGLKDTYMISLRVKNTADEGYSTDSFPLYVYNANALELEVNGIKIDSLTMDNESKVKNPPTNTIDIMALRKELALIEYIGINYKDYKWSQLKDVIKWDTTNSDIVSVNYQQGGLYEDLSHFSMETYLPETKMALSSIKDGTATITATHANTGMSASIEVTVNTLREKFYLFQFTPAKKTDLTYTDGKGNTKTVSTNDNGVLALYEPNGIASEVRLKAVDGDLIWMGTIYADQLLSGERDATKLALYPLNTFKLRQVAKVDIFLKKPDGSPYSGDVTLRGGVYKNGGYCQDAGILGNKIISPTDLVEDGKKDQKIVIGSNGKLTIYMDSTQFWSSEKGENSDAGTMLTPTDNIQYIFEVRIGTANEYYPLLIHANGNLSLDGIMRSAENVIDLEKSSGSPSSFISNQTIDYGLSGNRLVDVRNNAVHIGPNSTYPESKFINTVILWGKDLLTSNYKLDLCDEFGYIPASQTSQMITYPFSSMPVIQNTFTLSEATITRSGWIKAGKEMGLKARLSQNGTLMMEQPLSQKVTDLTYSPKLADSKNIKGILVDLQSSTGTPQASMSNEDKIVNTLLGLVGDLSSSASGTMFKMIITPGEDVAVFNAFIWAGYNSLGLDDVDYDSSGLFIDTKLAESKLSTSPSLKDMKDMSKGEYGLEKGMADPLKNQAAGNANKDFDLTGQLEGYFEAQIQYNFTEGKWEIYVLGGGFTVGFGMNFKISINQFVGPVPVTAEFVVGGGIQIDFKAALRYSEQTGLPWASTITSDYVNDYLTTLRFNIYVSAFAGIGFDYSVIALKVGLFGKISADFQFKFLSRTYLEDEDDRQLNGQGIELYGEVGIKFVAQFLFVSYEFILASVGAGYRWTFNDWAAIDDYWTTASSGIPKTSLEASLAGSDLVPVSASATLQSREYLDLFARSWGNEDMRISMFSLDSPNVAPISLQTNAYPYTFPLVSDDGELLLYTSDSDDTDVSKTRMFATELSGGSYPEGAKITAPLDFEGFGDSGLSLAGDKNFAAAAWVRQNASLPQKSGGETLSYAEQALLMNSTEIVTAVYNGAKWTAIRLTDNALPDMAPVVAVNGDKAIVAWRSVYSADNDNLLDFSQQDYILYSIYDKNTDSWSEPQQLYNGTSGAVKGISAAMLSNGTAAIAYTLYALDTNNEGYYEIGYTIVDTAGDPTFSAIIAQDKWLNENPQITAVNFGAGDERFVLGWHSAKDGVGDIRLASIYSGGSLSNSFIDSIRQAIGRDEINISGNFKFAKMNGNANNISNLSIIWAESAVNDKGETDHGILRAVKFITDNTDGNNIIRISAPLDVAELPERTLIDHFDAYVSGNDGKTVKAVIQGTEYKKIDLNDDRTYNKYEVGEEDGVPIYVYVGKEETKLFTATETYQNKARLDSLLVDYANLSVNTLTPIQFTIFNAGMDTIEKVNITIEGETTTFTNLALYPNESKTLTCWYITGDTIENLDYKIEAYFSTDFTPSTTLSDKVYMDYPDLGISQFKVLSEEKGFRTMQMTLYNAFDATLAGNKNRSVKVGFYDDSLFENIQKITCTTPGVTVNPNPDNTLTISDESALALIDDGAFTIEVSFNIGEYVEGLGLDEIPESGIRLYANAWIIEEPQKDTAVVVPEFYQGDNSSSVLFENPFIRSGQLVSVSVKQGLSGNGTTADIALHNNSLQGKAAGNLIATLLDENGNVLETIQQYKTVGIIYLNGEETEIFNFGFTQSGSRVVATYGDIVTDEDNSKLASLSFEGLPVRLSDFVETSSGEYTYMVNVSVAGTTYVSFAAANPDSTVKVNNKPVTSISDPISLPSGDTIITVEVTAKDGITKTTYTLTVRSTALSTHALNVVNGSGSGSYTQGTQVSITANAAPYGQVFDGWVSSNGGSFANANSATTTFTMPGNDVTVTATYRSTGSTGNYVLNVINGSGSGSYTQGTQVSITANAAPYGQAFDGWVSSNGGSFANANNATTTFTMPDNDVTVTATYRSTGSTGNYVLNVVNGSGSGSYAQGTQVSITANAAPYGQAFDSWVSSNGGSFANANSATTTFTMPGNDVTVTATYRSTGSTGDYVLNVVNGSGSGSYAKGAQVSITANVAPYGQVFDGWVSSNGGSFANANSATTTFTMPGNDVTVTATYRSIGSIGGTNSVGNNTVVTFADNTTITVNGVTIPATVSSSGVVMLNPTEAQIKQIIMASVNGKIVFNFDNIAGIAVTGVMFKFYPVWFNYSTMKTLTFNVKDVGGVTITAKMLKKLAISNKELTFKISKGSLVFDILADGKSIGWYDYENPILVAIPTIDANVVMKNIPRCWVKSGTLYGLVYTTGRYEAVKAEPINFTDTQGKWMNPAAQYMSARGIISGIGNNQFAPDRNVTRAEFVTMLMRALNIEPQGDWRNTVQQFSDVSEGVYYYDALLKAKLLGIVSGVGNNMYNPNATITRQDMFLMLYNAMVKCGSIAPVVDTEEPKWFENYTDNGEISSYAKKAMATFIKEGIVTGKGGGILDPKGTATRGEAAQIIYNMLLRDTKE